jgi:hypothetical protein
LKTLKLQFMANAQAPKKHIRHQNRRRARALMLDIRVSRNSSQDQGQVFLH